MSEPLPSTVSEALEHLRSQPGVNVTRQPVGTIITVITLQHRYELLIVNPAAAGRVQVSGNDIRLSNESLTGQFLQSTYGIDEQVAIDNWIGRSMKMHIRFKNGVMITAPAINAAIRGKSWSFEVF